MKYKITCRAYTYSGECPRLNEYLREIEARYFEIKNGFVGIWTEQNGSEWPDIRINANDVLTIERIDYEGNND